MSILLIILVVLGIAVLAILALAASRPNSFRLERSTWIQASPEAVYPLIADFKNWTQWSPFEGMDTDLKRTYEGAARGVGAAYAWEGRKAGAGRMEIIEAIPSSRILIQLDFTKPFEAHNQALFTLTPEAGGTRVAWAMYGPMTLFPGKLMGLFFDMEKFTGPMFEQGLASLKTAAESSKS